jgi:hypothetical protein
MEDDDEAANKTEPTVAMAGSTGNNKIKVTTPHLYSANRTNLDKIQLILPLDELVGCLAR